jgi:hypothetical protein
MAHVWTTENRDQKENQHSKDDLTLWTPSTILLRLILRTLLAFAVAKCMHFQQKTLQLM